MQPAGVLADRSRRARTSRRPLLPTAGWGIHGVITMVTNSNEPRDDGNDRSSAPQGCRGNGRDSAYPTIAVRYGYLNTIGEFTYPPSLKFGSGAKVIIKSNRGIEVGEQVLLTCPGGDNSVTPEQLQTYIHNSGSEYCQPKSGRILRVATADDLREDVHLRTSTIEKREFCRALAHRFSLPLKVVACEHLLGGERIIFYFLAEGRVDFRALVKDLATEYQTRIEMRQVGVRDEARLLADYETCGRECCCKTFLKTLRPVNMKMAKMQKATLDPSKVSGRCGRLKCCLRYEHLAYEELEQNLPKIGAWVSSAGAEGIVVNRQILTQLVQLQMEDSRLVTVAVEELRSPKGDEESVAAPTAELSKPAREPADESTGAEAAYAATEETTTPDEKPADTESGENQSPRRRKRRRKPRSGRSKNSGGSSASPPKE